MEVIYVQIMIDFDFGGMQELNLKLKKTFTQ